MALPGCSTGVTCGSASGRTVVPRGHPRRAFASAAAPDAGARALSVGGARFGSCSSSATTVASSSARATFARQRPVSSRWCASSTWCWAVRCGSRPTTTRWLRGSSPWATSTSRASCGGWPGRTRGAWCSSSGRATPLTTWPGRTRRRSTRCAPTPKSSTRPPSSTGASWATPTSSSAPTTAGWSATPSWPAPRACRRCCRSPPTQRCCARRACPPPPSHGWSSAAVRCATSRSTTSCPSTWPAGPASTRCCSSTARPTGRPGGATPRGWPAAGARSASQRSRRHATSSSWPVSAPRPAASCSTPGSRPSTSSPCAPSRWPTCAGRRSTGCVGRPACSSSRSAIPKGASAPRSPTPRRSDGCRGRAPVTCSSTSRATRCGPSAAHAPGGWSTSSASSRSTPGHRCSAPSGPTTVRPSGRPSSTSSAG